VNTDVDIQQLASDSYQVKALQGQVATQHLLNVDPEFLARMGLGAVDGATVVRETCDILVGHEALTAVPGEATLEQLVVHYPYLASELQERLLPGATPPHVEPVRAVGDAVEDHPTHT
jgi:hypothetical protein